MNTSYQKKLAAKILKCSPKRVKVSQSKDVEEALTRNDVRHLIVKGLIVKKQIKGTPRANANYIAAQKKKGRRGGRGRRGGVLNARTPRKQSWMKNIRALRRLLDGMRENGQIGKGVYGKMYRKAKGGEFRNKKHMLAYLKDNKLMKEREKKKKGAKNG